MSQASRPARTGSTRGRVARWAVVLTACATATATAQSPSAPPVVPPVVSPAVSPPSAVPRQPRQGWDPVGPAHATVRRDGLTLRLWLSDTVVEPGTWVQAHVRVTNTGPRVRFHEDRGPCVGDPIDWRMDVSGLFDPGREWPGLAGRFKEELAGINPIPGWVDPAEVDEGIMSTGLAECMGGSEVRVGRLAPGASIESDHWWYPSYLLDRPLPPGPFTIGVSFKDWGRGQRPDRGRPRLDVEVALLVPGPHPGYPSPLVLIDRALSVPEFFAYVTAPPGHRAWTNTHWLAWWALPSSQVRWADLEGRVPNGFLGIGLFSDAGRSFYAVVNVDPWTGEVLS